MRTHKKGLKMDELIWVRIETTKSNNDIWAFKGQISKEVFEGVVCNKLTSGYFKLEKVYWITTQYDDDGNELAEKLYRYGQDKLKAFAGHLYLRIEHLVSIAPIDGELELAEFLTPKQKPLSLVTPIRP